MDIGSLFSFFFCSVVVLACLLLYTIHPYSTYIVVSLSTYMQSCHSHEFSFSFLSSYFFFLLSSSWLVSLSPGSGFPAPSVMSPLTQHSNIITYACFVCLTSFFLFLFLRRDFTHVYCRTSQWLAFLFLRFLFTTCRFLFTSCDDRIMTRNVISSDWI